MMVSSGGLLHFITQNRCLTIQELFTRIISKMGKLFLINQFFIYYLFTGELLSVFQLFGELLSGELLSGELLSYSLSAKLYIQVSG